MSFDFIPQCIKNQGISFKDSLKTAAWGILDDGKKICKGEEIVNNLSDLILKVVGLAIIAFGVYLIALNLSAIALLPHLISDLGAYRAVATIMSIVFTFFSTDIITISETIKEADRQRDEFLKNKGGQVQGTFKLLNNFHRPWLFKGTYLDAMRKCFRPGTNPSKNMLERNTEKKFVGITLMVIGALCYVLINQIVRGPGLANLTRI